MSSNIIILIVLIINALIAVGTLIWKMLTGSSKLGLIYFVVILSAPGIGALFLSCAHLLYRSGISVAGLEYADISFDATRHVKKQKEDFAKEVDILPLEEAFAVSETPERRRALLNVLKKDYAKNISTILSGLDNDDTETSHYAASVVLSTTTEYLNEINKLKTDYENEPDRPEAAREYLDCLKRFIESNIPDVIDKRKYLYIYFNIFDLIHEKFKDYTSEEDYVFTIEQLTDLNDRELAGVWAERALAFFPENSDIYYIILKMYYKFGDKERFFTTMDEIMESDINITNDMLMMIRFFNYQQ